ncbi:MAG TPA: NADH-quinone oxidoreductase subunit NuoG [Buchnera sp. (in: enterobacteria)]|nr:NADH-quinone oxidoreductase subunit NuoG [Buchnera sp. (in: enterobacteria)]
MAKIYIDGKKYNVDESNNLLHACLSVGINIPYFCWHPILGSIGSCRQCAVKQYDNIDSNNGKLIMSCMTPALDGMIISINDIESAAFRKGIIELFMTNHPHDCPVCEEGGNCHLQDMTVMTGHNLRRYNFTKRTHKNQYLGPFISHEMNRCIGCYRCIRYYKDYADGKDLGVYGTSNNIYFGRLKDGDLESQHSGNLVEICPTGVFTDKTYSEHYHRKWDMQYAPSICNYCSIGCNISVGERYGEICRIENRYHGEINHYLICDLGRFGYGYSNIIDRPVESFYRINDKVLFLNDTEAITKAVDLLSNTDRILGIGSNRASIESNFALKKMVGNENFSTGLLSDEQNCVELIINILKNSDIHIPTLCEIETYDAILILGEDLTQVAPRIALSVRQAVKSKVSVMVQSKNIPKWHSQGLLNASQNIRYDLFIFNIDQTELDDIATWSYTASVDDQISLACSIAHDINKNSPIPTNFNKKFLDQKSVIVRSLLSSKKPLIISGSHSRSVNLIQASFNIALALKKINKHVGLNLITSGSNSIGVSIIKGMSLNQAFHQINYKKYDAIIIMENDLYRSLLSGQLDLVFRCINKIIVIDYKMSNTVRNGTLFLSAANFFESSGTVINYEGRAQRFFKVYDPKFYNNKIGKLESWKWLHAISRRINTRTTIWNNMDDVINDIIVDIADLKGIKHFLPDASFRIFGQKIARSPHRASGRTALRADISVHEPKQPQDIDSMFSFSMEGSQQAYKFSAYVPFAWSPGWNSPQAWNKFQNEINGSLLCGNSGIRLFNNKKRKNIDFFKCIPDFLKREDYYYIVPYYFLFGTEEITQDTPVLEKKIPMPHCIIGLSDAKKHCLGKNSYIEFVCLGERFRIKIRISNKLASGQIGLPLGIWGMPFILSGKKIKKIREIIK